MYAIIGHNATDANKLLMRQLLHIVEKKIHSSFFLLLLIDLYE